MILEPAWDQENDCDSDGDCVESYPDIAVPTDDAAVRHAITVSARAECVPTISWTAERERILFEQCAVARVVKAKWSDRLDFQAWGYDWMVVLEGRQ